MNSLLVPQCLGGIQAGGLAGREKAENHAHRRGSARFVGFGAFKRRL